MKKWMSSALLALCAGLSVSPVVADGAPGAARVERLDQVLSRLSPVSLPQGAWAAYSLCMMEQLSELQDQRKIPLNMLVTYIKTFDDYGSDFPGDVAYRLDRDVIAPCMQYNPIIAVENQLHAAN